MSRTYRRRNSRSGNRRSERRLRVVGVRRDPPDVDRLSRTLLAVAMQRAEAEAKAIAERAQIDDPISEPDLEQTGEVADDC